MLCPELDPSSPQSGLITVKSKLAGEHCCPADGIDPQQSSSTGGRTWAPSGWACQSLRATLLSAEPAKPPSLCKDFQTDWRLPWVSVWQLWLWDHRLHMLYQHRLIHRSTAVNSTSDTCQIQNPHLRKLGISPFNQKSPAKYLTIVIFSRAAHSCGLCNILSCCLSAADALEKADEA